MVNLLSNGPEMNRFSKWHLALAFSLILTAQIHAASLPDFSLTDINGGQFQLREHLGAGTIVISFWATWCAPCKQLLTRLEKMRQENPELQVLAISVDDSSTLAGVKPYVVGKKFGFSVLFDTDSKVLRMFDPDKKIPVTVVADKNGHILYSRVGYIPGDEREIQNILKGAK
jgi:cytochrome c biogenesis protein CcmG, thiol:disulfide interchange protein DsbE